MRRRYESILAEVPSASVYQTLPWLSVFKALSHDLVFVEVGNDVFVPFLCKGKGMLRRAYSLPYDTYGGPIAMTSAPVQFHRLTATLGVPTVRTVDYASNVELNGGEGAFHDVATYVVDLEDGYEAAFKRYADTNQRLVRQSADRGLLVSEVTDERLLGIFHRLHMSTMRKYRAQMFPFEFYQALFRFMVPAGLATFYLAWDGDRAVGGNIVLRHGRAAYDWEWVYDDKFADLRPTNALIDRAIRDEAARGARQFNLGASPDERMGSVRFKKSFGAEAYAYRIFTKTGAAFGAGRRIKQGAGRLKRRLRRLK